MIGYTYIESLFKTIINASLVMEGRFYVCPNWGAEMNNPNIEGSLAIGQAASQKYPAAMLMPPPKEGNFEYLGMPGQSGASLYDVYTIKMLFVTTNASTGQNQVQAPNGVGESTHTVVQTWHDMDRVAQNFCSVLRSTIQPLGGNVLFWDDMVPRITLVTSLGNDDVSGVMLTFKLAMYSGCTIEDYAVGWQSSIVAPALTDPHLIHKM